MSPSAGEPTAESARQAAWGRYWKSGALHSCATSFDGNYGGTLGRFWKSVFDALAPGDRVLDVATGNGAIPWLLLEARPDDDISCDAIDRAQIRPTWLSQVAPARASRVHLHGGVRAEQLPFEDARFALITSQFGIEYTDLDSSLAELHRVVRRPGRLAWVVHHARSRPVHLAREEIGHIGWLQQSGGLLDCARDLVRPMRLAGTPAGRLALASDSAATALRGRFNELQRDLSTRATAADCPDVLFEARGGIAAALEAASRQDEQAALQLLDFQVQGLQDNLIRLSDLCRCALDATQVQALVQRLAAPARATIAPVEEAGHLMAWSVVIELE